MKYKSKYYENELDFVLNEDVFTLVDRITELKNRIAELEAALAESHLDLQSEQSQHATCDYEFTTHPLLEKE